MLAKIFTTVTRHQKKVARTYQIIRLVYETYQAFCTKLAVIISEDEPLVVPPVNLGTPE